MSYEEINSILEEFINEENISEKIMTKKQAKRKKALRAKRRAEKLARQQAEQKKLLQQAAQKSEPDTVEAKLVDDGNDGGDNNNGSDNNKEEENQPKGTALVPYKKPTNEDAYEQVTEEYKQFLQDLYDIISAWDTFQKQAISEWGNTAKDGICPPAIWADLNNGIIKLKDDVDTLINQAPVEKFAPIELILLNRFSEGFNGYLDKAQKQILAAKPDISEDDLKEEPGTAIIKSGEDGENSKTTYDSYNTKVTKNDKNQLSKNRLKDKDTRKRKDLVTYNKWIKGWHKLDNNFVNILKALANLLKMAVQGLVSKIWELGANATAWISDTVFGFLTSPIAKDFVKTLMYSNPITAMIFDGKFGSFGITGGLDKIKKATHDAIQKTKNLTDYTKSNPDNYDKRKFPKSSSKLLMREIKWNLYSNTEFNSCINVSYNHPDVRQEEKVLLKKSCDVLKKAIKDKDINTARKALAQLIETLNDICDSMDWKTPKDWMLLTQLYAVGNTDKENAEIEKKAKDTQISDKKQQLIADMRSRAKSITKNYKTDTKHEITKDELQKRLKDDYPHASDKDIQKAIEESYSITTRLQQLCENALA